MNQTWNDFSQLPSGPPLEALQRFCGVVVALPGSTTLNRGASLKP